MRTDFNSKKTHTKPKSLLRAKVLLGTLLFMFIGVQARLFYWQIIKGTTLEVQASQQYEKLVINTGKRGSIFTSDDHLLVGNEKVYRLFAEPHLYNESKEKIQKQIGNLLLEVNDQYQEATDSAVKEILEEEFATFLDKKLSINDKRWVGIISGVTQEVKNEIDKLNISGLGFDPYFERFYPEASMAAHITGFVGKDESGEAIGYFGVEGSLNKELSAKQDKKLQSSFTIDNDLQNKVNGRNVTLTIRRDIQFLIENELKEAMEKYGAASGEVIVMNPQTGKVLGLASYPNYDQKQFYKYPTEVYKNPSISNFYEPGSTFKALTVAIGIEQGVITPETQCNVCDEPRKIGKYTIRTWNDVYNPDINMTDALAKSDNTAMIFIEEQIGTDDFINYTKKFGFGQNVTNDLQEDATPSFPDKWGPVELATRSFGQGISATSLQVIRAINSIANGGLMVQPQFIEKVTDSETNQEIASQVIELEQVVSKETAQTVTKMLVESAKHGEAQWIATDEYLVAGKTGTSQVANESGGYDDKKTIASFIGFAPADHPKFIMLTKLNEPTSSPWAAETAAPLWYKIADKLILMLE
ncbi:MAG: penicillin-binding protein 2 [Candidatus Pacebacteria bacterium]|nr:penicillin-binding protein 2 [Candidatus Paceibacterota bacterium]